MEVLKQEHPLCLIDLQPTYPEYEEEYDDETGDLVTQQDFKCRCDCCKKRIYWFDRYYYKCAKSCNYTLHKWCAELPLTLNTYHTLSILLFSSIGKIISGLVIYVKTLVNLQSLVITVLNVL